MSWLTEAADFKAKFFLRLTTNPTKAPKIENTPTIETMTTKEDEDSEGCDFGIEDNFSPALAVLSS